MFVVVNLNSPTWPFVLSHSHDCHLMITLCLSVSSEALLCYSCREATLEQCDNNAVIKNCSGSEDQCMTRDAILRNTTYSFTMVKKDCLQFSNIRVKNAASNSLFAPSVEEIVKEAGYHRTFDLSPRWARVRKPLNKIHNFIEGPYTFWTSTGQNPYILHGTICFSFHFLKEQVKINPLTNFEWNCMVRTFWKIATSAFFVVIWEQFSVDFMNKMMNFELNFDCFFKQPMLFIENNASSVCPEKISSEPFIVFEKWIFPYEAWFSPFYFKNSSSWLYWKFNISKTSSANPIFLCIFEISIKFGLRTFLRLFSMIGSLLKTFCLLMILTIVSHFAGIL